LVLLYVSHSTYRTVQDSARYAVTVLYRSK
jgi:hypothetical protein